MSWGRAGLQWLYNPVNALPVCLAAGFLLPSNAAWSTFFYLVGWPSVLLCLVKGWRPEGRSPSVWALLALWGWSSLTIIWELNNSHHGDGRGYWLLSAVSTLALLLCFFKASRDNPKTRERVITVMVWASAVAAMLSIVLRVLFNLWNENGRLGGWGALHVPVLGAAVVVVCILLALSRLAEGKFYYAAPLLPLLVYLPLNGSRTALLALVCGLVLVATGSRRIALYLALAGMALLGACAVVYSLHFGWVDGLVEKALARGTDCHVTIWRTAWGLFLEHPWFGYGPSARLPILPHGACPAYPSPHNLYLSLLLYSGLVGFVLFWLCEAVVLRRLLRLTSGLQRRFALAVMLVPLVAGLSDLTQVIKGPSPLWYIIWLPLLLVVSLPDADASLSVKLTSAPPKEANQKPKLLV